MSKIEKIKNLSLLFDAYKNLLTDIQRQVFVKYYMEDYSLSEIANISKKTRSAIMDTLKKVEKKLYIFEKKLGFVEKFIKINKLIDEFDNSGIMDIDKLKEITF